MSPIYWTLAAAAPPAAAALYHDWAWKRRCGLRSWFGAPEWRSEQPAVNRLMLRLQAALRAEQGRHLRLVVIGASTVWVAFLSLVRDRGLGLLTHRGLREQRYSVSQDEMLPPLAALIVLPCLLALRPTDRIVMRVVCLLNLGAFAYVAYDVRSPQARAPSRPALAPRAEPERAHPPLLQLRLRWTCTWNLCLWHSRSAARAPPRCGGSTY